MSFTQEELLSALRNADAAGDTEAATRIANILSSGGIKKPSDGSAENRDSIINKERQRLRSQELEEYGVLERGLIGVGRGMTTIGEGAKGLAMDAGNALGFVSDEDLSSYDESVKEEREYFKGTAVGQTTSSRVGEFAGEVLPSVALGGGVLGAGAKVAQKAKLSSNAGKTASLMGLGATEGALISDTDQQGVGAVIGGATAGVLDKTLSAAGKFVNGKRAQKLLDDMTPNIDYLKNQARNFYDSVKSSGAKIKPKAFEGLSKRLQKRLKDEGYRPKQHSAIKVALDDFDTELGQSVSFSTLDALRKAAKDSAKAIGSNDSRLANIFVSEIDDFVDNITPMQISGRSPKKIAEGYKEARKLWGRAKKAELIKDMFESAEVQESGLENGLRIKARQLFSNPRNKKYFSDEERELLKALANGDSKDNILKHIGKFGVSGGHQGQSLLPVLGAAFGGVDVVLVGSVAKKIAEKSTDKRANRFYQSVLNGGDATSIARAYTSVIPKKDQSAKELAEMFRLSPKKSLIDLEKMAKRRNRSRSNIYTQATGIALANQATSQ
jgi:hypothetical protein